MRQVRARSIVMWVLSTLAWVAAVDLAALAYLRSTNPNPTYRVIRTKWNMLLRLDKPVDWLILGDSSANNGAVTAIFERRLGGRALNLATMGAASALNQAWMLETYLDRFPPPKGLIVIDSVNVGLTGCQRSMIAQVPVSFRRLSHLMPTPFTSLPLWGEAVINRYVPLYAENVTLGTLIRTPWQLKRAAGDLGPVPPDGFMPRLYHQPEEFTTEARETYLSRIAEHEPMSDCVEDGLATVAAVAESCGVPAYFTTTPVDSDVAGTEIYRDFFARVRKRVESFGAGRTHFHYLPPTLTFSSEDFYTRDHLLAPAAEVFSTDLAERIAKISST